MSMKQFVLTLIIIVFGTFVGSVLSRLETKSPFAKHAVINAEKHHAGTWLPGKPSSPIRIHLYSPRGIAYVGHETTTIQAMIQLTRQINHPVQFRWELPPEAQLVQGDLMGTLPELQPGQIYKVSLTITGIGLKELPRNISLTVSTEISGQPIAATGIFASHDMQPDGSFRARREKDRNSSWFSKTSAQDDEQFPTDNAPKGIHF